MEQVQRLQSIEREMLSEGRSSSDIDAFKARLRQESFTGENPQFSGVGSLSETARDMNRGPRGLAVYMDKGGDPSVVRLGGRRTKNAPRPVNAPTRDGNQSMALTNEDIETLVDFTPFFGDIKGGADGAEFIKEELKRDEPNYLLMGIVGGAAVVGLVPVLGDVAQKLIMRGARNFKKDRVTEETLSMLSEEDARIVQDLTNKTPETDLTQSEILADSIASDLRANKISRVTDERLEDLDFKGEIRLRQHYIDGNVGVDADGVPITLENSQQRMIDQGYNKVGVHGTKPIKVEADASNPTKSGYLESVPVNDIKVFSPSSYGKSGSGVYLDVEPLGIDNEDYANPLGVPYATANRFAGYFPQQPFEDSFFTAARQVPEGATMYPLVAKTKFAKSKDMQDARGRVDSPELTTPQLNALAAEDLSRRGYTGIDSSHYGEVTSFDGSGLRVPTAIFDPRLTKLKNIGMADGGAVMQGVGSLNETARGMSRGPRGIGAYQQFADGGELNVNLRPLDLPVDGRMSYTQTDDGGRFNSEIRKTFEGGLGSLTPSFDYSTQNRSRNMGDVVIDEDGEQIGFALEGELFLKPQSEDKVRGAFAIEKSRNNTNFTFPEGEFVETRDGLLKRFNLGMDLGSFGIDLNRTEASGREPINKGSATIRVGENGIIRYSDSDRGEPNIEFNYRKQFADGGPVYMSKGGGSGEESVRDTILSTIYGIESNNDYNAWNNRAKNPPSQALTSLTVKEIMDYQGNENGPAAGAGQIKYNTLKYLLNTGTLSEDDLFTESVQDAANNKLLDRRGFNSWLNGEIDNLTFGSNIASEWASIPLLFDQTVNGKAKERGDSRYGGSNEALIGADAWENVLYSARASLAPVPAPEEIMLAEAYSPQTLVSEVMAGEPTYMTNVTAGSPEYSGMRPLDRSEYPKEENAFTMFVPEEEENAFTMFVPEEEEPEALKAGLSLYEKYAPSAVQDALLGIGYLNSVTGPSR